MEHVGERASSVPVPAGLWKFCNSDDHWPWDSAYDVRFVQETGGGVPSDMPDPGQECDQGLRKVVSVGQHRQMAAATQERDV